MRNPLTNTRSKTVCFGVAFYSVIKIFYFRQRERQLPAFSSELLEKRALLVKRWTNYKREQHLADLKDIDRIVFAQQKALDQLRRESEELYQEAIQARECVLRDILIDNVLFLD